MNTKTWDGIEVVVACAVVCAVSLFAGASGGKMLLRQEAATEGVGEYKLNPFTGRVQFEWEHPTHTSRTVYVDSATVTNEPTHTATALALKLAMDNSENLSGLVKLSETMVQKIIDLSRRVTELEQKRFDQFLQPRYEFNGPSYTNLISTNVIDWSTQGTNVYLTNLYLGQRVTITNGMLYIQN